MGASLRPVDPDKSEIISSILNAAWMVRHYQRAYSIYSLRIYRKQAILRLGITVREAFNLCDDYEALLKAIVDGLNPSEPPPRF